MDHLRTSVPFWIPTAQGPSSRFTHRGSPKSPPIHRPSHVEKKRSKRPPTISTPTAQHEGFHGHSGLTISRRISRSRGISSYASSSQEHVFSKSGGSTRNAGIRCNFLHSMSAGWPSHRRTLASSSEVAGTCSCPGEGVCGSVSAVAASAEVCVCVRERDGERKRVRVCACVGAVAASSEVCVCVRERERER